MELNHKTELYRAIKSMNLAELSESDKEDLLRLLMQTPNVLLRDRIAFILSDLHYTRAIPFILRKINQKDSFNNNGSLVYALQNFNMTQYFIPLIRIVCDQDYEARLSAFSILQDISQKIPKRTKNKALQILNNSKAKLLLGDEVKGENSTLHFVEQLIKVLVT